MLEITRIGGTAIEVAIVALIIGKRLTSAWPSVLTYCLLSITGATILIATHNRKVTFYTYWIWIFTASILRMWVMADVVRSFPGAAMWNNKVRGTIAGVAAVIAAGAWYLSAQDGTAYGRLWIARTVLADRCVALAWGFFLVVVLMAIRILHISWNRTGAIVTMSMVVKAVAAIASSLLLSIWPGRGAKFSTYVLVILTLAFLSLWLWAFVSTRSSPLHRNPLPSEQS